MLTVEVSAHPVDGSRATMFSACLSICLSIGAYICASMHGQVKAFSDLLAVNFSFSLSLHYGVV